MAELRCWGLTLAALTLVVQTGRSEGPNTATQGAICPSNFCGLTLACPTPPKAAASPTCVIYSLADLGEDPNLGQWIAETVPQVIEPGTWKVGGPSGKCPVLSYYPPKKILVVYHTPAVQARVAAFLKEVKKTLAKGKASLVPAGKRGPRNRAVVPVQYLAPEVAQTAPPAAAPNYACPPAPARPPKHLFHFIIRYEGAGIIDSNVLKYMKLQNEPKEDKKDKEDATLEAGDPPLTPKEKDEKKVKEDTNPSVLPGGSSVVKEKEEKKGSCDKKDKEEKEAKKP
jgi:hypothetical protein